MIQGQTPSIRTPSPKLAAPIPHARVDWSMDDLSADCLERVFAPVDLRSLCVARAVSRRWRGVIDGLPVWPLLAQRYGLSEQAARPSVQRAAIRAWLADQTVRAGQYEACLTVSAVGHTRPPQWRADGGLLGIVNLAKERVKESSGLVRVVDVHTGQRAPRLRLAPRQTAWLSDDFSHVLRLRASGAAQRGPGAAGPPLWFSAVPLGAWDDRRELLEEWCVSDLLPAENAPFSRFLVRSPDGLIRTCGLGIDRPMVEVDLDPSLPHMSFCSPSGEYFFVFTTPPTTALRPASCTILAAETGKRLVSAEGVKTYDPAWAPGGGPVAVLSDHQSVLLMDAESGSVRDVPFPRPDAYVWTMLWSPTRRDLLLEAVDGGAEVLHLSTAPTHFTVIATDVPGFWSEYRNFAWRPDGRHLVGLVRRTEAPSSPLRLLTAEDGRTLAERTYFSLHPLLLAWTPSGDKIAAAPYEKRPLRTRTGVTYFCLTILDGSTLAPLARLSHLNEAVEYLSWAPDAAGLVVTGRDLDTATYVGFAPMRQGAARRRITEAGAEL